MRFGNRTVVSFGFFAAGCFDTLFTGLFCGVVFLTGVFLLARTFFGVSFLALVTVFLVIGDFFFGRTVVTVFLLTGFLAAARVTRFARFGFTLLVAIIFKYTDRNG